MKNKNRADKDTKKVVGTMPSPPEFLLKNSQSNLDWEEPDPETVVKAQGDLDQWTKSSIAATVRVEIAEELGPQNSFSIGAIPESFSTHSVSPSATPQSKMIDYLAYQQAVEDRISAETGYAEIYSKYLELQGFNEKTLRTLRRIRKFKVKFRVLYDRALQGDQKLRNEYKTAKGHLAATERVLNGLQMENESLRISLSSHEEAYKGALAQISLQQEERDSSRKEFQLIAQEFENRGIIIGEADRKIRDYLTQIAQLQNSLNEHQEKYIAAYDGALLSHNKMRELEIRETGVSALNDELAQALTKGQKRIQELENKIKYQGEAAGTRILALEQEVGRLRENRQAENLVEKSKNLRKANQAPDAPLTKPEPSPLQKGAQATVPQNKKQWDDFYDRWSSIIDGLSSHSVPIARPTSSTQENTDIQLVSEVGDFEIL